MNTGQELYRKAKKLIPGGTQLLSKRPEMFLPDQWPAYYSSARGCQVVDLDGKSYQDLSYMGIGACILGYADPDVNAAVVAAVNKGSMSTLNAPEEVELAELMIALHPWGEMVRYARTGGEAVAIAVRIARAATGRDKVLFCGYHGWHDWYLAANLSNDAALDGHLLPGLSPSGVPRQLRQSSYPFTYNNTDEFLKLAVEHKGEIGAVVMEPIRNFEPEAGFLPAIRRECSDQGMALIVDEVSAGFRLNVGGAHLKLGVEPDIAVFAKGIGNGFPMAVVMGKKCFMEAAQGSFISSTYWTERTGPVAAIATIRKMIDMNVPEHLVRMGQKVQLGWAELGQRHGLRLHVGGIPPLSHFSFDQVSDGLACKTLFTQEMLKRGFLATTACYLSLAHTDAVMAGYLAACDEVFRIIAAAAAGSGVTALLEGPVCHSGFRRLS
jgi:glutamate-1-semialdehyde 2,1-aminomutase